jgi:hypothetical protein
MNSLDNTLEIKTISIAAFNKQWPESAVQRKKVIVFQCRFTWRTVCGRF